MDATLLRLTVDKFRKLSGYLNERTLRMWAATEAASIGRGGISLVSEATGLSRTTVHAGLRDLAGRRTRRSKKSQGESEGVRRPGGGRKPLTEAQPKLRTALERLVSPATRGDPRSPLRWTCKSTARLSTELKTEGFTVSQRSVHSLLVGLGYSLQSVRKSREGSQHEDRDEQFQNIAKRVEEFQMTGQPVISVDTKKKELVGDFANRGREWQPKGEPESVRVHDFEDEQLGKVVPYGVYDLQANEGWVSVGVDHDTAEFAVESIRRWWQEMGQPTYPHARRLLITADAGGSNGNRVRLWKVELQRLADETGLEIHVCHLPPGTSKWNKIEHRMFCHITHNWRGKPLVSREVVVKLIGSTTTTKGLSVRAQLDRKRYAKGIKVSDEQLAAVNLRRDDFHGEWNYSIFPHLGV